MKKISWKKITLSLAINSTIVATIPGAIAQDSGARQLEEIIVTARKRAENLQDVGISVSAMSKQDIERSYAKDISDLVNISSNLVIDDTAQGPGGVAAIYIRGIGVAEVEKNFDPAVGVAVDGVFIGATSGGILKSMDLERMEVLRGPQGTLFGRNTIAGVINLARTQPTGEVGGKVKIGYGDYDTSNFEGIVNFPVTDNIAAKLSAAKRKQDEGYFTEVYTGKDIGRMDYESLGANVLWSVTEALELEFTLQREETDQDTPPLLNVSQSDAVFCVAYGYCSSSASKPITGDRYKVAGLGPGGIVLDPAGNQVQDPFFTDEQQRGATFDADTRIVEARWAVNDAYNIDYIYGTWETQETVRTDFDGTPSLLFHTDRPAEYNQESHELRLTYDAGDALKWTLGGYLWESDYEIRLRSYIGFRDDLIPFLGPGPYDFPQTTNQTTDSWAVFFEGDYAFTDKLKLTLGGRYTEDDKTTNQAGGTNGNAKETWNEFTPKVAVNYQVNNEAMIYASYTVGYRSGGFNGRVDSVETAETPYDPETVENIELGFKSEWLDSTLRLNGAIFHMSYDDKQEEIQLPSSGGTGQVTKVVNASTATITGAEFELLFYPTGNLQIRANLGLLDAGYDDFEFDNGSGIVDNSDLDFRRAPEVTASISATYDWTVGSGEAWAQAGVHYIDDHETDFSNAPELHNDAQNLVDASVNYKYGNAQFSLFGRNLTGEDGYGIGFDVAGLWSYAAPRAPRTWGVEVSYTFGADN
ncbi:MAG: iron complex outermembrane receptor protein [Oceanicoccus sp.]|jgi:iron complex outermembrane receptor protein